MTTLQMINLPREILERKETSRIANGNQDLRGGLIASSGDEFSLVLHATLAGVGERFGLYDTMLQGGPITPACLATQVGAPESSVRIWLEAQASGDYIYCAPGTNLYSLWCPWSPRQDGEY